MIEADTKPEMSLETPTMLPLPIAKIEKALAASGLPPHRKIDLIESKMADMPQMDADVYNHFSPGIYLREIVIPKGMFLTSVVHKTEHPFFVLRGEIWVYWTDESGLDFGTIFKAGTYGVTRKGTRRILFACEETVWVTVHATDKTDPDEIIEGITSEENPLIESEFIAGWKRANARDKERIAA